MEKKALFFDYDGTIMDSRTETIPDEIPGLFARLKEQGHLLFLNTGRTGAILDPRTHALPFDGKILGCGSAVELEGKILYEFRLEPACCTRIAAKLRDLGIEGFLEGSDVLYVTDPLTDPHLVGYWKRYRSAGVRIRSASELREPFSKMFLFIPHAAQREALEHFIDGAFQFIDRKNGFWELVPAGHTKATGIRLVMDRLGLTPGNCYAFGDSNNDLPMLELLSNSALIGGEDAVLRQKVRYMAQDVLHGGLTQAVQAFGLLDPADGVEA